MDVCKIQLFTVEEAAAKLRMSKQFLYALDPSTPGVIKIGRSTRIDLPRFLAGLTQRRTGEPTKPAA